MAELRWNEFEKLLGNVIFKKSGAKKASQKEWATFPNKDDKPRDEEHMTYYRKGGWLNRKRRGQKKGSMWKHTNKEEIRTYSMDTWKNKYILTLAKSNQNHNPKSYKKNTGLWQE